MPTCRTARTCSREAFTPWRTRATRTFGDYWSGPASPSGSCTFASRNGSGTRLGSTSPARNRPWRNPSPTRMRLSILPNARPDTRRDEHSGRPCSRTPTPSRTSTQRSQQREITGSGLDATGIRWNYVVLQTETRVELYIDGSRRGGGHQSPLRQPFTHSVPRSRRRSVALSLGNASTRCARATGRRSKGGI